MLLTCTPKLRRCKRASPCPQSERQLKGRSMVQEQPQSNKSNTYVLRSSVFKIGKASTKDWITVEKMNPRSMQCKLDIFCFEYVRHN